VEQALAAAQAAGASYADARLVRKKRQSVAMKNGSVEELLSNEDAGVGVRVIAAGAWGFAATSLSTAEDVRRAAEEAVEIALASAHTLREKVELAPVEPAVAEVESWATIDPFTVSLPEKIDFLRACDAAMDVPGVVVRESLTMCSREEKWFASSEGADIYQDRVVTQGEVAATAADTGEVQRRSYPNSHGGEIQARGWEILGPQDFVGNAAVIAEEAAELIKADRCPEGVVDLILGGPQLALQVHESCGHPTELDRVLGTEASFAGTSFLTPDLFGHRYGSDHITIVADATIPGALGSFAYDDEGVPGQRADIIRQGLFVGYTTSRETAQKMGLPANGAMRADGWNRTPLIRMTCINLLPGEAGTLEDLIRDTDEGLLLSVNKSWSIDDRRLNFQFGCEAGYRIKGGEIVGLIRNPVYQGITPEFWQSCDAVCGPSEWRVWGLPNCGKGEPQQAMEVAHGVAAARFRQVRVGMGQ
jgi:TldD protein